MTKQAQRRAKEKKAGGKRLVSLSGLAVSALAGGALPAHAIQIGGGATGAGCVPIVFGSILACSIAGTVTVDTAGSRSTAGSPCMVAAGPASAGNCIVDPNQPTAPSNPFAPIDISIQATVNINNGSTNMLVNNFILATTGGAGGTGPAMTLVSEALYDLYIGATLNVGVNQAGGTYVGAATITANWQ